MANYVVSDTNLTLIADAIRAKSGHNELLEWPNEYKTAIDNLNPVDMCIKTVTDDVVSVSDAAQYDAKNVSIKIEPVQAGSGDPSPDNVRPITGWTGAKVTRCGKNLLNPHLYSGIAYNPTVGAVVTLTDNPVQFTDEGNGVFSVQTTATWQYFTLIYPIDDVNLSHAYSLSWASTGQFGITRGFLDENHTILTKFNTTDASGNWVAQLALTPTAKYLYFVFTNRSTASATLTIAQPQIELGSTATAYEPYQGQTYDIAFPAAAGTVYGGTLDVTNGVLTVDRAIVDLGTLNWIKDANRTGIFHTGNVPMDVPYIGFAKICSKFKVNNSANANNIANGELSSLNSYGSPRLFVKDTARAELSASEFKAAMSGVQLVYELATPITYTLTPQQVALLRGDNALWADTGDVTLKYFTTAFEDLAEEIGFADGGDY